MALLHRPYQERKTGLTGQKLKITGEICNHKISETTLVLKKTECLTWPLQDRFHSVAIPAEERLRERFLKIAKLRNKNAAAEGGGVRVRFRSYGSLTNWNCWLLPPVQWYWSNGVPLDVPAPWTSRTLPLLRL